MATWKNLPDQYSNPFLPKPPPLTLTILPPPYARGFSFFSCKGEVISFLPQSLAAPSRSEHNPGALGQVGSPAVTAQTKHLPSSSEPGTHSIFQTAHGNAWARRTAAQGSSVDNSKRETSTEHSYLPVLAAR